MVKIGKTSPYGFTVSDKPLARGLKAARAAIRRLFSSRGMTDGKLTVELIGRCPSYCSKCGRQKPRMDSSPCFACVLENVKEAERIVEQARAQIQARNAPMLGDGI